MIDYPPLPDFHRRHIWENISFLFTPLQSLLLWEIFSYVCPLLYNYKTNYKRRKTTPVIYDFQLEKLLLEVQKVSPGVGEQEHLLQEHLLSKCALFVCNKWDQVPPKERETVKNHVTEKLQKVWPGIDLESQIIYISTKNATKVQTCGYITEDFSSLMDGMNSVVLKSFEIRLEIHWRYVLCVCL